VRGASRLNGRLLAPQTDVLVRVCPCRPGYDGSNRINDFHEFDFNRKQWGVVPALGAAPSPRDRHVAVVYCDSFYVFAGFDGSSRVNDFLEFNFCEAMGRRMAVQSSGIGANGCVGVVQ